jgi:pimeloyl-ACP methyl ester carboxylesterase
VKNDKNEHPRGTSSGRDVVRDWKPLFARLQDAIDWALDIARTLARDYDEEIDAIERTRGYEVLSTENSLDNLEGDVAAVEHALGHVNSPAILVGHSYGGMVITAAGTDDRVAGLVYIAALGPDETETSQSLHGSSAISIAGPSAPASKRK